MEELALKIENISKEYRLGQIGGATLKGELQTKMAKLLRKEDPNLKIGEKAHEKNERFLALDGVSFEIKKGERIGILGHNGAGKSTLLKLICRVTAPSSGNIYMNGRITSMLEVGTGFHGELTGRDNIYLNGAILGMSKAEVDKKFDEIVEFSEIGQFIDTPIKRYSSGMKVKLGFAVASHLESEIMIMDEVLAVGDMAFQRKCLDRMRQVAEEDGRTILYVSHNMSTIRNLCTRCIVLEHGRVIFDGDVEKAIQIYMPHKNEAGIKERWNFSDCLRADNLLLKHKFSYLNFLNENGPYLNFGDKLKFEIGIESQFASSNICMRCMIYYNDEDATCMTSTQAGVLNINSGLNKVVGSINTANLAPGDYSLKLALYETDGTDNELRYDIIDRLPKFVIYETKTINGLNWTHQWWGHFNLGEIEID